jgi:hypothetical protein
MLDSLYFDKVSFHVSIFNRLIWSDVEGCFDGDEGGFASKGYH